MTKIHVQRSIIFFSFCCVVKIGFSFFAAQRCFEKRITVIRLLKQKQNAILTFLKKVIQNIFILLLSITGLSKELNTEIIGCF